MNEEIKWRGKVNCIVECENIKIINKFIKISVHLILVVCP